jgi:hypothetical protein
MWQLNLSLKHWCKRSMILWFCLEMSNVLLKNDFMPCITSRSGARNWIHSFTVRAAAPQVVVTVNSSSGHSITRMRQYYTLSTPKTIATKPQRTLTIVTHSFIFRFRFKLKPKQALRSGTNLGPPNRDSGSSASSSECNFRTIFLIT